MFMKERKKRLLEQLQKCSDLEYMTAAELEEAMQELKNAEIPEELFPEPKTE